jgi:hypothetical protein
MSDSYCSKIMKMSLEDLKSEYYNCSSSDKAKKEIIKQVARRKKEILNDQKRSKHKKEDYEVNQNINKILSYKQKIAGEQQQEREKLVQKRGHMERYWESNQTREKELEPHYKLEVERDYTNNKLMERLNSELDCKINEKKKSKEILKPYDNDDDEMYEKSHNLNVPTNSNYNTKLEAPVNNFSSKRLIH